MEIVSPVPFEIRTPSPDDMVAFRRLQAESWLATYPNEEEGVSHEWVRDITSSWLTEDAIEASRQRLGEIVGDPGQFLQVAFDGDELVGMIQALSKEDGTKHLKALYIKSSYYGTGLAQQLMRLAGEWIGEAEVDLNVAKYNARAIRFYEKQDFKIVLGSERLFMDVVPVVNMKRKGR